jgi:hypothetical protein
MQSIFEVAVQGSAVTAGGVNINTRYTVEMKRLKDQDPKLTSDDTSYVREIHMRFSPVIKNTSGGSVTLDPERLMDIVRLARIDAGGHLLYDLPEMAGQSLRHIDEIVTRRTNVNLSRYSAGLTVGNGASSAATPLDFIFRFFDPRGEHPEDSIFPVKLLSEAILTIQTCTATEFGSGVTVDSMAMPICTVQVVSRDEYKQPPLWTWKEKRLQDFDTDLSPGGVTYHDVFLIRNNNGAGVTKSVFASAAWTSIFFKVGDKTYADTIPPDDLNDVYNSQQVSAKEHFLAKDSAGTNDRVPIVWTEFFNGKATKKQFAKEPPKIKLVSPTLAVGDFRVLARFMLDITGEGVVRAAQNAGHPIEKGARAMPKTASKTSLDGKKAHHARNLPVVIVPPGHAAQ